MKYSAFGFILQNKIEADMRWISKFNLISTLYVHKLIFICPNPQINYYMHLTHTSTLHNPTNKLTIIYKQQINQLLYVPNLQINRCMYQQMYWTHKCIQPTNLLNPSVHNPQLYPQINTMKLQTFVIWFQLVKLFTGLQLLAQICWCRSAQLITDMLILCKINTILYSCSISDKINLLLLQ